MILSQKVLDFLTEKDFLNICKEKYKDKGDLWRFVDDIHKKMKQNIAIGKKETNLLTTFSNSVINYSKFDEISDDITLKNFLESVADTMIDSGPQISFNWNDN